MVIVIKHINGNDYLYEQHTHRYNNTIFTNSKYIGPLKSSVVSKDIIDYAINKYNNAPKIENRLRKGTNIPYYIHPFGVMNILIEEQKYDPTITKEIIIAGLFHDLNEDADVKISEIKSKYGDRVAQLVENVSEPDHSTKSWKERKEHSLEVIKHSDKATKLIFCADKLDNIRAIQKDIKNSVDVWKKFNAPKEEVKWYYEKGLDSLKMGISIENSHMYKQLENGIRNIFNG